NTNYEDTVWVLGKCNARRIVGGVWVFRERLGSQLRTRHLLKRHRADLLQEMRLPPPSRRSCAHVAADFQGCAPVGQIHLGKSPRRFDASLACRPALRQLQE